MKLKKTVLKNFVYLTAFLFMINATFAQTEIAESNSLAQNGETLIYTSTLDSDRFKMIHKELSNASNNTPDIVISGNGNTINSNIYRYSTSDGTDFGLFKGRFSNNEQTIDLATKNFTVSNNGSAPLSITNVQIQDYASSKGKFTLTQNLPATISANGSNNLSIKYTREDFGIAFAKITVSTNDPDTPEYVFFVKAENQYCEDCFNVRYSGVNCDACDAKFTNYPACDQCDNAKHVGADCDACDAKFTNYPACDQCTNTKHAGADCDACDAKFTNYPACDQCTNTKHVGADCDACVAGFTNYPACDTPVSSKKQKN